ncbi:unnamed protein product [Penicillium manginii]
MRAKVECPGYRDPLELKFRDQNEEVIRKSQNPTRKKRAVNALPEVVESDSNSGAVITSPQAIPEYPAQELARGYLFCNYMAGGPHAGHMSYLLPLIQNPQNAALNAALNAVGLAALSNIRMSPRMMLKARREYTTALSQTNHALRDPFLSKQDDTLAAVVLLGMFELVTCTDNSFIDRWMKHMEGAARLIEFRGPDQLARQEGLDLFSQLRAQISTSNIYREEYSSSSLTELSELAKQYRNTNDHVLDNLGLIVIRLTNFCAALKDATITDPSEIIRTALTLDAELMANFINVPSPWNYKSIDIPMVDGESILPMAWGTSYHIYHSIAASSMWNNYRSSRILIHELIIDTVTGLDSSETDQTSYQQRQHLASQSRQIARQLMEDICASAPFHLGAGSEDSMDERVAPRSGSTSPLNCSDWSHIPEATSAASKQYSPGREQPSTSWNSSPGRDSPFSKISNSSTVSSMGGLSPDLFKISGAGGLTLVWPLLIAANSGLASLELRNWITGCFDKIGYSMGINQALAMGKLLRNGSGSRAWLTPELGSPISV